MTLPVNIITIYAPKSMHTVLYFLFMWLIRHFVGTHVTHLPIPFWVVSLILVTVLIASSESSLGDNTHNNENNVKCYWIYEFLIYCILHLVWFHFYFTTKESVLRNDTRKQLYYHICIGFSLFTFPFICCLHSLLPTIYKPCQATYVKLHQSVQRSEGTIATCKVRTLNYGKGGILITACIIPPLLCIVCSFCSRIIIYM